MTSRGGRARIWLLRAALAAGAIAIAMIAAELALRAAGIASPNFYCADPICGLALIPNARGWQSREGRAYVRVNSDGWRDAERRRPKPPDTFRVAVLGDSFTEALQVDLEATFCRLLESNLAGCDALSGKKIEVLNFGISGYGTAQELLTLRGRVWDYSPDVVLLAFLPGNDVSDNSRALKKVDYVPYFVEREGKLALDDSFLRSAGYRRRSGLGARLGLAVMNRCRLLQAANSARKALRERRRAGQARGVAGGEELGLTEKIYVEPADVAFADAWRVTERLIETMNEEARAKGARFMLVALTNAIQVSPDRAAREAYAAKIGAADLFYAERRAEELGSEKGFPVLALAPPMQARAEKDGTQFHGFGAALGSGHWNEAGHRAAAELIAPWLCGELRAPD